MTSQRLSTALATAKSASRKLLIPYVMAGDPHAEATDAVLDALVAGGADIIELGFPFSDPMADGPTIQAAALRALAAGMTLPKVLDIVTRFRKRHPELPLVLMGYANPLYSYGLEKFCADAAQAGVDGLLIVDLPPEEENELVAANTSAGLDFIRLITPTTDAARLPAVLRNATGYLYYVSITGVTGTASADVGQVSVHLQQLKALTNLPVAIGFGIKTPQQAAEMAELGEAVVIGSALVELIQSHNGEAGAVAGWLSGFRYAIDREAIAA